MASIEGEKRDLFKGSGFLQGLRERINASVLPKSPETAEIFSPFEKAVLAIAIGDAYTRQAREDKFEIDLEFFALLGNLCSHLPHGEAAVIQARVYERIRREAVKKVAFQMAEGSEKGYSGHSQPAEWIKSCIKDKSSFLKMVSEVEDQGDEDSEIDLRWKFREVLKAANKKFFSLRPELLPNQGIETPVFQPAEHDAPEVIVSAPEVSELPEIKPRASFTVQPFDENALTGLVQRYRSKEKTILESVKTAREHAHRAGLPVVYNSADEIFALFNMERNFSDGQNYTPEQAAIIKREIKRIIIREARSQRRKKAV